MVEQEFYAAVRSNDVEKVMTLLKVEELDVNWANGADYANTALHTACKRGHHEIVRLLLLDPRIFVNAKNLTGGTPFHTACSFHTSSNVQNVDTIQLLMNDARVDVDCADNYGASPLWLACFWGHLGVLKCIIASEREMNLTTRGRSLSSGKSSSPLEIALEMGKVKAADLLQRYLADPQQTRSEARIELGLTGLCFVFCVLFLFTELTTFCFLFSLLKKMKIMITSYYHPTSLCYYGVPL
jgi:ankyrin repeat protein